MSEVFDKATEKAMGSVKIPLGGRGIPSAMGSGTKEGLASLGERLYSEYEKLPWYKQLPLDVAPGTGETISAYEAPIFAEKTKEAYEKGDLLATAGHGALTGLSVLGAIPFLGAGIRGVKAGVKGVKKGLSGLSFGPKGVPSKLSPKALEAFENVSNTQRYAPEIAMSKIQSSGTVPELFGVVEHIGDLTHVLTNEAPYGNFRRDRVRSKIAGQLGVLENPNLKYFIEKGHKSLSTFNKAEKGISESVDTIRKRYHKLMQKYADEHRKIPVFNRPQKLARDAAVAIGERRFKEAAKLLRNLDKIAEDPTGFQHAASIFRKERARKGLSEMDFSLSPTDQPVKLRKFADKEIKKLFGTETKNIVKHKDGLPVLLYHSTKGRDPFKEFEWSKKGKEAEIERERGLRSKPGGGGDIPDYNDFLSTTTNKESRFIERSSDHRTLIGVGKVKKLFNFTNKIHVKSVIKPLVEKELKLFKKRFPEIEKNMKYDFSRKGILEKNPQAKAADLEAHIKSQEDYLRSAVLRRTWKRDVGKY